MWAARERRGGFPAVEKVDLGEGGRWRGTAVVIGGGLSLMNNKLNLNFLWRKGRGIMGGLTVGVLMGCSDAVFRGVWHDLRCIRSEKTAPTN